MAGHYQTRRCFGKNERPPFKNWCGGMVCAFDLAEKFVEVSHASAAKGNIRRRKGEGETLKTNLTQRRIKARKSSACGLCKPWKQGWADKKTVRDIRHAQRAQQQFREAGF
jgi:hypothetical protein